MSTHQAALQEALELHRLGQWAAAEQIYRRIVALEPRHRDAWQLLAMVLCQSGDYGEALTSSNRALEAGAPPAACYLVRGQAQQALGRMAEARASLEQAIGLDPTLALGHYQLGLLEHQSGQPSEALRHYEQAFSLRPDFVEARVNYGDVLRDSGRLADAVAAYHAAAMRRPDCVEALANCGAALVDLERFDEAVVQLEHLLQLRPQLAEAHYNLGKARQGLGQRATAIECFRAALGVRPDFVLAHSSLGAAWQEQGDLQSAAEAYCSALAIDPHHAEALANYGKVLHMQGHLDEALGYYNRALECRPALAVAHFNRVVLFNEMGPPDRALDDCRQALRRDPNSARLHANMAVALRAQGRGEEAIECYRRAIQLDPDSAADHSNLVYALNFSPHYSAETVFAEHLAWAARHAEPLTARAEPCSNDRRPDRRLRVGYVSPYFRRHAVNYFTEPMILAHDHEQFEIVCYSDVLRPDATTARIQASCDVWREVRPLADHELAQQVRNDRIDILVDLTGHIAGNRLLTFARKPAPVQVTYIGYHNTTGLSAMDYRLTDDWSDPPGLTDHLHTERLERLPRAFFCYRPHDEAPEVTPLPAVESGVVTFGSFNSFMKVTPQVISAWLEILDRVTDSRLLVLAYRGGYVEQHLHALAGERGIDPRRIELYDACPTPDYLRLQQRVDIALDPFPLNGHTTTCDSLWMGVPVVMLAGDTHPTRLGGSVLVNMELDDLIARDTSQYVDVAVGLAGDRPRLEKLRRELRPRMAASAVLDFSGFTRNLEAAYHRMWRTWCEVAQSSS